MSVDQYSTEKSARTVTPVKCLVDAPTQARLFNAIRYTGRPLAANEMAAASRLTISRALDAAADLVKLGKLEESKNREGPIRWRDHPALTLFSRGLRAKLLFADS